MSKWYVAVEGQARGPVSTETVLAYLQKRNPAQVYVWREGSDDWCLAKDIAELRGAGPPPVPLVAVRDADCFAFCCLTQDKLKPGRATTRCYPSKLSTISMSGNPRVSLNRTSAG